MTLFRLILSVAALALATAILWAMGEDGRSLGVVIADLLGQPWAIVTLADLYLGFVVSSAIIVLAERRWTARLFWIAPIFVLGNPWMAVWVVSRLPELARRLRRQP
jgi:hypothetical protein